MGLRGGVGVESVDADIPVVGAGCEVFVVARKPDCVYRSRVVS